MTSILMLWLVWIAFISGAQKSEEGVSALEKGFGPLPEKTKACWPHGLGAIAEALKAYPNNVIYKRVFITIEEI